MNSIRRKWFLLCLLVLLLPAAAAFGQDWPLPASTPNTDVPCSTCTAPGKNLLKTIGYPPVLGYVGRFVDSETSPEYQYNFRTVRARGVRFAPAPANRIYMMIGSSIAAYDTDTFFARTAAHEAMVPATSIPVSGGNARAFSVEKFLWWDRFFYAESGGQWTIPGGDGQDRLYGFDFDDRGLVYLGYSVYGWGIVRDDFGQGGAWMTNLASPPIQLLPSVSDVTPWFVASCKTADGAYYAVVSSGGDNKAQVWNVSNPTNPVKQGDLIGHDFTWFAKDQAGLRVATINNGQVKIYSMDAFVKGGNPIASFAFPGGQYWAVTTDGTNFYAMGTAIGAAYITVINGTTYAETRIPTGVTYNTPGGIRVGAGFLSIWGTDKFAGGWDLRLYKVGNGGALSEVPLNNYFVKYYSGGAPAGYTAPSNSVFLDVGLIKHGTKPYIVLEANGMGDVYEIKAGDALTARLASTPTPFYGDAQTFTSALSSNTPVGVNWTFDDNTSPGHTIAGLPQITHQFGGITSEANLPATRHATATNETDSAMTDTIAVTLAKPSASFKLAGTSFLFKTADASSPAPIVTSDQFVDTSDGSGEGHYVQWTLDTATTNKPSFSTQSAGDCGVHTVRAVAHYGPYDTATFVSRINSDVAMTLGPVTYASRPFAVSIQEPAPSSVQTSPTTAVFTPVVRPSTTTNDLPGGTGTACSYTWNLVDSTSTVRQTLGGTATLATIPTFSVPRSQFSASGMRVTLVVSVQSGISTGCASAGFSSHSVQSSVLSGPQTTLVVTGCANVGGPCKVTASGGQPDWSYTWSVSGPSTVPGSTAVEFLPVFPATGTYTVTLVVTNGIGSATVSTPPLVISQPLCPTPIESLTAIGFSGNTSGCFSTLDTCTANETISFRASTIGWSPADCNTYRWDFGDGAQSTDARPTHQYATNGTYAVKMDVTGVNVTAHVETSVKIGSVVVTPPPPPPGGGGGCLSLNSLSAYVGFIGNSSGCTSSFGTCNPAENLLFTLYPQNGYNFNCGTTSFQWSFSDGASGSGQNFTHAFGSASQYTASCTVSNSGGTQVFTATVQVGSTAPKVCGTMTQTNTGLTFGGPNCTDAGGDCRPADTVAFSAVGKGSTPYDFSCGTHTYQWTFGDGGQSSASNPTHAYTTAGTYTASVTITQTATNKITLSHSVTVSGTPTGGTGQCPTMYPDSNVFISFLGSQCFANGPACNVGEAVAFRAAYFLYDFGCGSHTFSWDFGDGGRSTEQNPTHVFATDGTYRVTLHVTNAGQSVDLVQTVKVGSGLSVPPRHRPSRH